MVAVVGGVSSSDNRIHAAGIPAFSPRRRPPSSGTVTTLVAVHFVVAVIGVSSSDNHHTPTVLKFHC